MITCALLLSLQTAYLPHAHAHNDYAQSKPLTRALELGFASIEVDVFPVNGDLLVGHDKADLNPKRTFRSMYLEPLLDRIQANGGSVYGPKQELWLLVDLKENGAEAYQILKKQMAEHVVHFTSFRVGDGIKPSAIRIVLSGDRPTAILKKEQQRWAFIDGRLSDLEREDAELMPLISDSWIGNFAWRGVGTLSKEDQFKLQLAVGRAKRQRQRLRFWAAPDTVASWTMLRENEVDFVGTDRPLDLAKFFAGPTK